MVNRFKISKNNGDILMNIRKITSLTAFISFFVVVLTSVILYIAPQGRVAYWADWKLMALWGYLPKHRKSVVGIT
jgi:hypothetical protein